MRRLNCKAETWTFREPFVIARGSRTQTTTVIAEIFEDDARGRGECLPYPRYDQTVESVTREIEAMRPAIEAGCGREELAALMPAGAGRNALDCALWDLEAKLQNRRAWEIGGISVVKPVTTAYTLSVAKPAEMAKAAAAQSHRPIFKLKIAGRGDVDSVRAVRETCPDATLLVDANESLGLDDLSDILPVLRALGVVLIEQPLAAARDDGLGALDRQVALCADESIQTRAQLQRCIGKYECISIKLDKTGGLTEGLALCAAAKAAGLKVMVSCMATTSLGIAPAWVVAQNADYVDLDAPLLLERDRDPRLRYAGSVLEAPQPELWG